MYRALRTRQNARAAKSIKRRDILSPELLGTGHGLEEEWVSRRTARERSSSCSCAYRARYQKYSTKTHQSIFPTAPNGCVGIPKERAFLTTRLLAAAAVVAVLHTVAGRVPRGLREPGTSENGEAVLRISYLGTCVEQDMPGISHHIRFRRSVASAYGILLLSSSGRRGRRITCRRVSYFG